MKANNVDVYVRVKSEKVNTAIKAMLQKINSTSGVHKAGINQYVPSIVAIEYDPFSISSQGILASIREQGYQATLIGM